MKTKTTHSTASEQMLLSYHDYSRSRTHCREGAWQSTIIDANDAYFDVAVKMNPSDLQCFLMAMVGGVYAVEYTPGDKEPRGEEEEEKEEEAREVIN